MIAISALSTAGAQGLYSEPPPPYLARGVHFHSEQMHVIERLTRPGNRIRYEVTVQDPEVLAEPWVMTRRTMTLNPNLDSGLLPERGNCEVYETKNMRSQIRH